MTVNSMRPILRISFFLNFVALLGLVIFLASRNRNGPTPAIASTPVFQATNTSSPILTARFQNVAEPRAKAAVRFEWKQLYSSDYHLYVKNLRATGCPELTVRAIVTADVDSVYQLFAAQMEKKLSELDSDSWSKQVDSYSSQSAWRTALQKIPEEESAKIADLLGLNLAPDEAADVTAVRRVAPPGSPTGPLPLALQDIDFSTLNLNANQKQLIADLRQQFLQRVGDPIQDQNDPAYRARLKKAQPEMDGILKAMIGHAAFANYQLEVVNSHAGSAGQ